jgi:hypothetical protein
MAGEKRAHSEPSSTGLSHSSRRKKAVTKLCRARQPELAMIPRPERSRVLRTRPTSPICIGIATETSFHSWALFFLSTKHLCGSVYSASLCSEPVRQAALMQVSPITSVTFQSKFAFRACEPKARAPERVGGPVSTLIDKCCRRTSTNFLRSQLWSNFAKARSDFRRLDLD